MTREYICECGAHALFTTDQHGDVLEGPEICKGCGEWLNPLVIERSFKNVPGKE